MAKKVKKMAFGGMGSGMVAGMVGNRSMQTKPQSVMQQMQQMQPRGALGGNQPPAGADLMQKYNGPPSAPPMQPRGALGGNQPPAGANLTQAYQAQAGQPSAPPAFRSSIGGMGMKKGGKTKSASSRADGCAIRGKTRA